MARVVQARAVCFTNLLRSLAMSKEESFGPSNWAENWGHKLPEVGINLPKSERDPLSVYEVRNVRLSAKQADRDIQELRKQLLGEDED